MLAQCLRCEISFGLDSLWSLSCVKTSCFLLVNYSVIKVPTFGFSPPHLSSVGALRPVVHLDAQLSTVRVRRAKQQLSLCLFSRYLHRGTLDD